MVMLTILVVMPVMKMKTATTIIIKAVFKRCYLTLI